MRETRGGERGEAAVRGEEGQETRASERGMGGGRCKRHGW